MAGDRPQTSNRGDVRAQLLASATRQFAEHGFDGTPLQAVADEVGVAKQSLLHHFPSKDALRREVLGQMFAHWNRMLPRLLMAATAADDRWEAVVGALEAFFQEDPARARLLLREALDRPDELRPLLAENVRPFLDAVAGYIHKGQRHGEHFPDVDAEAYALSVTLMVIGGAALAEVFSTLLEPARAHGGPRYMRELRRLAKAGLFAPLPQPLPGNPGEGGNREGSAGGNRRGSAGGSTGGEREGGTGGDRGGSAGGKREGAASQGSKKKGRGSAPVSGVSGDGSGVKTGKKKISKERA